MIESVQADGVMKYDSVLFIKGDVKHASLYPAPCDRTKHRVWRLTCAADLRPKQTQRPHSGRVWANVPRLS